MKILIGKIIGKQGRNAMAIRTMLGAATTKMKKNLSWEFLSS